MKAGRLRTLLVLVIALVSTAVYSLLLSVTSRDFNDFRSTGSFAVAVVASYFLAGVIAWFLLELLPNRSIANLASWCRRTMAAVLTMWLVFSIARQWFVFGEPSWIAVAVLPMALGMLSNLPGHAVPIRPGWKVVCGCIAVVVVSVSVLLPLARTKAVYAAELLGPYPPAVDPDSEDGVGRYLAWYDMQQSQQQRDDRDAVEVMEFVDYTCGACKALHDRADDPIAQLMETAADRVHYSRHLFPLDSACNSNIERALSQKDVTSSLGPSCLAAIAVKSAGKNAGPLERSLFSHKSLSTEHVHQLATIPRPGTERYGESLAAIKADVLLAQKLGVRSVPAFFINGVRAPHPDTRAFQEIVKRQLSQLESGSEVAVR